MQQYNLIALHSLMAVVEAGSFKRAAEKLEASTAAVSRRVSSLGNALSIKLRNLKTGTDLFQRPTQRINEQKTGTDPEVSLFSYYHA